MVCWKVEGSPRPTGMVNRENGSSRERELIGLGVKVQRQGYRYDINTVAVVEDMLASQLVIGNARDISTNGLYVESINMPKQGAWVRVEVEMPSGRRQVKTDGTVVRSGDGGFAVQFDEPCHMIAD